MKLDVKLLFKSNKYMSDSSTDVFAMRGFSNLNVDLLYVIYHFYWWP
jgi:hypothetical protein